MNSLEKEVLKLIGEDTTTPDVFTDDSTGIAQIRDSINDAIQEITMVTGSYRKTYFIPLMAGKNLYRMDWTQDYFGYVVQAWDRNRKVKLIQTDLVRLSSDDPTWLQRTGSPDQYFHVGANVIGIYMKPSASGTVIECDCVCIPKEYTENTDDIKIRTLFQRAVVQYAVGEFYASRGDAVRATQYFNNYLEVAVLKKLQPESQDTQTRMGGYSNSVTAQ